MFVNSIFLIWSKNRLLGISVQAVICPYENEIKVIQCIRKKDVLNLTQKEKLNYLNSD